MKLSMEHVNAICHAEFFTDAAISKLDGNRMRKTIENDMMRLAELKLFIIQQMTNAQKLFPVEVKDNGHKDT